MSDFFDRFDVQGSVPCIFGCDEAIGIFFTEFRGEPGCICKPDQVQALCAQHALKAQQNGVSLRVICWMGEACQSKQH